METIISSQGWASLKTDLKDLEDVCKGTQHVCPGTMFSFLKTKVLTPSASKRKFE